nr:unnamed protein product [Callosobruchus chinensis]
MVVRFITKRYIGEYDPTLEKIYTFHTVMDNEMVYFEILDTAGQPHVSTDLVAKRIYLNLPCFASSQVFFK